VVGGGDTAIDSARVSRRLGAEVTNSLPPLPRRNAGHQAGDRGRAEEGVQIEFLAAPVEIQLKDGLAVGMRAIRMGLGEPDASAASGRCPSRLGIRPGGRRHRGRHQPGARVEGLDVTAKGAWIQAQGPRVDGMEGVFTGGDDVELGLVTIAIAQGRFAAEAIDAYIQGKPYEKPAAAAPSFGCFSAHAWASSFDSSIQPCARQNWSNVERSRGLLSSYLYPSERFWTIIPWIYSFNGLRKVNSVMTGTPPRDSARIRATWQRPP